MRAEAGTEPGLILRQYSRKPNPVRVARAERIPQTLNPCSPPLEPQDARFVKGSAIFPSISDIPESRALSGVPWPASYRIAVLGDFLGSGD